MLSRVRTKNGLFLRRPLSKDLRHYSVPPALERMLHAFQRLSPTYWNDDEYNEILN